MELNDLKEYLKMIVDMERNILLIDNTVASIEEESSKLGIYNNIAEPEEPEEKVSDTGIGEVFLNTVGGVFGIAILVFGIIMFAGGVDSCKKGLGGVGFIMIVAGLIISWGGLCLGGLVITPLLVSIDSRKIRKENEKNQSVYREERGVFEEYCKLDAIRVKNEEIVKENFSLKIESLRKQRADCKEKLDEMYSLDIVYPKYRNFTMMSTIYEYISSGRCYSLEGPDGAYNILEMEIRMDRIIVQLDLILSNLEQIKANQYMIYGAIQENNRQQRLILESTNQILSCVHSMNSSFQDSIENLKSSLKNIDKNSAFSAYQQERARKELEYMNTMNYLESKYRGTGFNQPPSWRS
ncbi:MAG: DUF308 domain-containing protein [Oscillospiraceae bacterium]|nr:DUF308 domain-containing protein [Oscillospiraceae bacterium]